MSSKRNATENVPAAQSEQFSIPRRELSVNNRSGSVVWKYVPAEHWPILKVGGGRV
jgi:hypothetical protein